MEQVKSFENIKENKPPPDPQTQRVTLDIKHSHTLLNGFPERRTLFIVAVCPLSQNSALAGDK